MENLDKKHSYINLLQREQKHIQLLLDLITLNLPVESYLPLVRFKAQQLLEELQQYNHEEWLKSKERIDFIKSVKTTDGFIDNRPKNNNIGHLAGGSKNVSNNNEVTAYNNLVILTQEMIEELINIKTKYKIKGLEEKIQKFLLVRNFYCGGEK